MSQFHSEAGEIIAHVALNIFTNYFNNVAKTEIEFPRVDLAKVASLPMSILRRARVKPRRDNHSIKFDVELFDGP
jgi:hypothetical protein